ncbi:MAG: glycerate kinase [Betaproteobacteria bacterium]|jgi:hydroxypyruvate reductase|nr:MAG: glycerate kinase [Betaproteobacteria bacterium]PZO26762.1 MAG: glycerate kinase [Betaproteobacteria bacterium]
MSEKDDFYKDLLTEVFDVGVLAAQPEQALKEAWHEQIMPWLSQLAPERERVWVFGAGKAAASMAKALEGVAGSSEKLQGFVVTRRGHEVKTSTIEVVQAAHPVPDEDGQRAARRLHKAVSEVPSSDAVIALVSGGGSSLLSVPVRDIPFVDLQQLNRALLACGAPIDEMNIVRKHVTQTLGGQLAQVCRAPVFQLLISDVPGDDPSSIASGPFSPDESTFHDAMEVIKRWAVQVPHSIARYLEKGIKGAVPDTPKRSSLVFRKVKTHLLASNLKSLNAVTQHLEVKGYKVLNLGDTLEGEARDVAQVHAAIARQAAMGQGGWPAAPLAIISGGECTVTLNDTQLRQARGGRNSEFLLALAFYLRDMSAPVEVAAIAADTDGIDGIGGHAGALMLPGDRQRCKAAKLAPQLHLDQHTSYDYFKRLDRLLMTGPTMTNVNDLRIILIGKP